MSTRMQLELRKLQLLMDLVPIEELSDEEVLERHKRKKEGGASLKFLPHLSQNLFSSAPPHPVMLHSFRRNP